MAMQPATLNPLKPVGFLLLLMGWGLVVFAIVLLKPGISREGFVAAGAAVEVLGLTLVVRSHITPKQERD